MFGLFLRLTILAVKDMREGGDNLGLPLKVLIPIESAPFTKDTPLTSQELSMLYDYLSLITIAIYLNPNTTNTNSCIT